MRESPHSFPPQGHTTFKMVAVSSTQDPGHGQHGPQPPSMERKSGQGAGGIKVFCYEPLRLGSHQPILSDAETEHNGCSDDGMREARGDE